MDSKINPTRDYYSTPDAARIVGLSTYMIDYLCREKLVVPSAMGRRGAGRGKARRYTYHDLVLMRCYSRLLAAGISVKRLKDAYQNWKRHISKKTEREFFQEYLISDGENVYIRSREKIIENLNSEGQLEFSFVIDLQRVREDLNATIMKLRTA